MMLIYYGNISVIEYYCTGFLDIAQFQASGSDRLLNYGDAIVGISSS